MRNMMQIHVNLPLSLGCWTPELVLRLIEGAQVSFRRGFTNIRARAGYVDLVAPVFQIRTYHAKPLGVPMRD